MFCNISNKAQGTVEAAVLMPVMLVLILLLVQPAIVLYDLIIMKSAAAEACRLIATTNSDVDEFIRRRLSAIPQTEVFHMHDAGCSYEIEWSGANSSETSVTIKNRVKALPLIDMTANVFGSGEFEIVASSTLRVQPRWLS